MLIEIFTKQIDKKNTVLTLLSAEPQLQATGEKISVPGLVLYITANYLLFKIKSPAWAERIIPLLFSVKPINAAGQLHEPASDMKIIITAKSYEPTLILPHLHELSHLDIERSELLGIRMVEWRSRDVAVVANAELAVQGGIITARIKFISHFRDSQYNCQVCIDQVSIGKLIKPLSPEFIRPHLRPKITGPVIKAYLPVPGTEWAMFINWCSAPVIYRQDTDSYLLDYGEAGHIEFKQKTDQREIFCSVELNDPQIISTGLIKHLHDLLGLEELTILHAADNIMIPPEQLINQLSFHKEPNFHSFSMSEKYFTALYDIKNLNLTLNSTIKLNDDGANPNNIRNIHTEMVQYMHKVLKYAI